MIPVLGKLKLFLTDKELIIPQGSLYIINSQEIHGMHHTEDTDIYKGYALQINYDFIKKYYLLLIIINLFNLIIKSKKRYC